MAPDLDVDTLRLVVAVAETGSLTAAAADRGISQPAASARVRAFEARWRLSILDRGPRGSTLTTDGLAVVSWARLVLHEADTMRAALAALSEDRRTELRVAASLTIAEFVLPRWLGELRTRRDDVRPRLDVVNSERVVELVRSRAVDIGFIETAGRPRDLNCKVVGADRLIVVVEPRHPWARRSLPIPVEDLAAADWVLREPGSGTRSTFESALRRQPRIIMEAASTSVLLGAARSAVGPAVVSARAAAVDIDTGRLVRVRTNLDLSRPLTAVWSDDRHLTEVVSLLVRIAVSHPAAEGTV